MAFTTKQVAFLQALAAQRPASRSDKVEAAGYFCENHGIGVLTGRRIDYRPVDFERTVHLLRTNGLPIVALGREGLRSEAARFPGQSEKSGTRGPSANAVAVKGCGGCQLAGWELLAPPGAFVTLTVDQACAVSADVLLVVENKETFRYLESYTWIDYQGLRVLALFRGDGATSERDMQAVLSARSEPIWAFMDFDPAGLGIASKLPRLARLILPPSTWLERTATGDRGRMLYDQSLGMWESLLDAVEDAQITEAWNLLKYKRHGVAQEAMLHCVPQTLSPGMATPHLADELTNQDDDLPDIHLGEALAWCRMQDRFLRHAHQAIERAKSDGTGISLEELLSRMDDRLEAARKRLAERVAKPPPTA